MSQSRHVGQLYAGLELLRSSGVVSIEWVPPPPDGEFSHVVTIRVADHLDVTYDFLDGLNWVPGDEQANLDWFASSGYSGAYFKRGFAGPADHHAPPECRVRPLGLLCYVRSPPLPRKLPPRAQWALRARRAIGRFRLAWNSDSDIPFTALERPPRWGAEPRVLFASRLWADDLGQASPEEREAAAAMDHERVTLVQALQRNFGRRFVGGIKDSPRARELVEPTLLMTPDQWRRARFLDTVSEVPVCVTSQGLHRSVGARMGEFVASSRAIVTTRIPFELPGGFAEGEHYLGFETAPELVSAVDWLLTHPRLAMQMMVANWRYYNSYLRPDMLVLNSLSLALGAPGGAPDP